ncbi:ThuA domain-containing protein [Niastella caeni]|uniref:ThuA domain-containing protein n=1 Tax=Niastella caeni TaxID=2569763 RepID=A0A4S8I0I3_9BACT|nr:ThuA domain-containing protein [Niastella caeni]THU39162.1 ThuA domain-containing protein [Niastella caeni]
MKKTIVACQLIIVLTALITLSCTVDNGKKDSILVFSKTAGYHHKSIDVGIKTIQQLGLKYNFTVDTTTDSTKFVAGNLKKYAAVIFLNTTGDVLNDEQQNAFQQYIKAGGGFAGVHAASDTEYGWPWFGKLVGAYFVKHPKIQEAVLIINDSTNIATKHLPRPWKRTDEWYNFKDIQSDLHVLISIDETSYSGGSNGANHPMSWYHNFDGGRAFYTALGHTEESYADPLFQEHLWGGIKYAMGK